MTVIQATSRGVKGTLSDGTVRFLVEVDPAFANDAFALFGMPGAPIAIARLQPEAALEAQQEATIAAIEADKPKGGELAKLAGMFCQQAEFRVWARGAFDWYPVGALDADDAAACIREVCGIESRAELDHNEGAAEQFHERIRRPYVEWRKARGLNE